MFHREGNVFILHSGVLSKFYGFYVIDLFLHIEPKIHSKAFYRMQKSRGQIQFSISAICLKLFEVGPAFKLA